MRCKFAILVLFAFFSTWTLPTASSLAQETGKSEGFNFTKVDTDLLDEVDQVDALYAKKGLVLENPGLQAYLDEIGKQVTANIPVPDHVQFRFKVLRDSMANAYAAPNGTVYITTGLLAILENEAQLVAVLGHETTHIYKRHSYIENRSNRKKALAFNIFEIGVAVGGSVAQGAANSHPSTYGGLRTQMRIENYGQMIQMGSEICQLLIVASIYGYSRDMEREADQGGLAALISGSYDPRAQARLMDLLEADSKVEFQPIPSFYEDHPKLSERRKVAVEFADAHPVANPRTPSEKEFLQKVAPAIVWDTQANINGRRERAAVEQAKRLSDAFPDTSQYQVLLADAYRALGPRSRTATEEELSRRGLARERSALQNRTEEEEERNRLKSPEGQAALKENQAQAESIYQSVLKVNPQTAEAFRGLGYLYEEQGKYLEAIAQYRHYLDLVAGTSLDHLRIEHRLAALEKLNANAPLTTK